MKREKEKEKEKERRRNQFNVSLWGPTRRPIKLTSKNSGSYECVFGVDAEGYRTFSASKGDRIIVERYDSLAPEKKVYHEGIIVEKYDNGDISWFDEVREQWFIFNWQHENIPLVIRRK